MRRPKVWARRLGLLAAARGGRAASLDELASVVDLGSRPAVWAALYAMSGRIPADPVVVETVRRAEFDGAAAVIEALDDLTTAESARREVLLLVGRTLVDVGQTATDDVGTGIQRVAREVVRRWVPAQRPCLVGWTEQGDALRTLSPREVERLDLDGSFAEPGDGDVVRVVVPLDGAYVCPELNLDPEAMPSMLSLGHHGGLVAAVIGFDCVPITSAETAVRGVPSAFANHLAALRHFDRVVAISNAAAGEFEGWRTMLGGAGLPGPEVEVVGLPTEIPEQRDPARAAQSLATGSLPVVLVVGSQEPRKNHGVVLAAAERLWREGHAFSLSLVGGAGWENAELDRALRRLQEDGRPVATVRGLPDAALYSAYETARFTVFPSLNEGFGLPVAESLAAGTPVVTSDFGSMREIAADGGALLVDPRDDDAVTDAMRRLLTDDALLAELAAQARARPRRTWDDYAEEAWAALTRGQSRSTDTAAS